MRLPENDKVSISRAKLHDDLIVAMGGRVAEEIIFGHDKVTTGASSDIEQATKMARAMVTRWGLSEKVGTIDYSEDDSKQYSIGKPYSQETGKLIDQEIKNIIDLALNNAKDILTKKKEKILIFWLRIYLSMKL